MQHNIGNFPPFVRVSASCTACIVMLVSEARPSQGSPLGADWLVGSSIHHRTDKGKSA